MKYMLFARLNGLATICLLLWPHHKAFNKPTTVGADYIHLFVLQQFGLEGRVPKHIFTVAQMDFAVFTPLLFLSLARVGVSVTFGFASRLVLSFGHPVDTGNGLKDLFDYVGICFIGHRADFDAALAIFARRMIWQID